MNPIQWLTQQEPSSWNFDFEIIELDYSKRKFRSSHKNLSVIQIMDLICFYTMRYKEMNKYGRN